MVNNSETLEPSVKILSLAIKAPHRHDVYVKKNVKKEKKSEVIIQENDFTFHVNRNRFYIRLFCFF